MFLHVARVHSNMTLFIHHHFSLPNKLNMLQNKSCQLCESQYYLSEILFITHDEFNLECFALELVMDRKRCVLQSRGLQSKTQLRD